MIGLTKEEILILLEAIRPAQGGYSTDDKIARLQSKLSIMLEVRTKMEG